MGRRSPLSIARVSGGTLFGFASHRETHDMSALLPHASLIDRGSASGLNRAGTVICAPGRRVQRATGLVERIERGRLQTLRPHRRAELRRWQRSGIAAARRRRSDPLHCGWDGAGPGQLFCGHQLRRRRCGKQPVQRTVFDGRVDRDTHEHARRKPAPTHVDRNCSGTHPIGNGASDGDRRASFIPDSDCGAQCYIDGNEYGDLHPGRNRDIDHNAHQVPNVDANPHNDQDGDAHPNRDSDASADLNADSDRNTDRAAPNQYTAAEEALVPRPAA